MENKIISVDQPSEWSEAFPIGNGKLGAMIFGYSGVDRIQLNEDSLWSGGFRHRVNSLAKKNYKIVRNLLEEGKVIEAEKLAKETMFPSFSHMCHYQTAGDVWIDFGNQRYKGNVSVNEMGIPQIQQEPIEVKEYLRELDLAKAKAKVSYSLENKRREITSFVSHKENIIVYRITGENLSAKISYTRKDARKGITASFIDEIFADDTGLILAKGHNGSSLNGLDFCIGIKIVQSGGDLISDGSAVSVKRASEICLFITIATSFRYPDVEEYCRRRLVQCSTKKFKIILRQHERDFTSKIDSFSLKLGSETSTSFMVSTKELLKIQRPEEISAKLIQLYFNFARYLQISSSNEDSLPSNLQGIWNEEFTPAWGSKYTININTQMNYWFNEQTGLSSSTMPLLNHLKLMHPRGKKVAKEMYGIDGFVCHHNTDLWGDCAPQDNSVATIWPLGGAWLCICIWKCYEYSLDKEGLMEYFPILRDAVNFLNEYMFIDKNGLWVTGPSVSPENLFVTSLGKLGFLCNGPAMDIQIVVELFKTFLKASQVLAVESTLCQSVRDKLEMMQPILVNDYNRIQEWREDYAEFEKGHRHFSHLYALYPGELIDVENNQELAIAAENTLSERLLHGGGKTGWSQAWILNLWAKLKNGDRALQSLYTLFTESTYPNLLDKHPPFQIDGNFGGAMGILQCIIQDNAEAISLLPAISNPMSEGQLKNYRSKHGVFISTKWKDSKIYSLSLEAWKDAQGSIILNGSKIENNLLQFSLKNGQVISYSEQDIKLMLVE